MKKKITILFTCVGRRVSLVQAFRQACSRLGFRSVILGTDTSEYSPALQCCDRRHIVKPVHNRLYASQVVDLIKRHRVDILIPTVDLDLITWARRRSNLSQLGCTALISKPDVVKIAQDKRLTYRFLLDHGFDTPETISAAQALKRPRLRFPCFLKPWDGYASRGNLIAHNRRELEVFAKRIPNCLVQDFIDGQEHTVDVLVDFDGCVRCVVPRRRLEVRMGEVSKAVTTKNLDIINQSKRLVETLGAGPGVITIQCFLTDRKHVKFIEINPRFGGGVPLAMKAGAAFPRWILQLWLGRKPRIALDAWRDGLAMLRYDEAIWYQK